MADLRAQRAFACLLAIIAIAVVTQGCGPNSSKTAPREDVTLSTASTAAPLSGTIVCGHLQATDVYGQTVDDPEIYILSSMNNKLRYFPDFARAAGMTTVKTCAEARAFGNAYLEYSETHPGFDDHQPRPSMTPPPQPAKMVHEVSVPKIWNGSPAQFGPIVAITALIPTGNTLPGQPQDLKKACSGTFIAKNFIATAAHCFAAPAAMNGMIGGDFAWNSWYTWEIDFPGAGGVTTPNPSPINPNTGTAIDKKTGLPAFQTPLSILASALMIPDPDYMGQFLTHFGLFRDDAPNDFALLYIPPLEYDGNLPAFIAEAFGIVGTPQSTGDVLPISTIPPDPSWPLTDFGYGPTQEPAPGSSPANLVLNRNQLAPGWTLTGMIPGPKPGTTTDLTGFSIMQNTDASISTASLCTGDSGGPLIRNFSDSIGDHQIIVAVNSRHENNGMVCGQSTQPADDIWSRMDIEVGFITDQVAGFYGPKFTCKTFPDSSNPSAYATCWGSLCVDQTQCSSNEYCLNPTQLDINSVFLNGQPCTNCFGTRCDCTLGQCIPLPRSPLF